MTAIRRQSSATVQGSARDGLNQRHGTFTAVLKWGAIASLSPLCVCPQIDLEFQAVVNADILVEWKCNGLGLVKHLTLQKCERWVS